MKNEAARSDVVGKFVGQDGRTPTGPMELKGLKLSGYCRAREVKLCPQLLQCPRTRTRTRTRQWCIRAFDLARPRSLGPDHAANLFWGNVYLLMPSQWENYLVQFTRHDSLSPLVRDVRRGSDRAKAGLFCLQASRRGEWEDKFIMSSLGREPLTNCVRF